MTQKKRIQPSVGQTLSSFSTSDLAQQNLDSTGFYQDFIRQNSFKSAKICDTYVKIKQNGKSIKPFAVYVIVVYTAELQYNIQRRYSNFRQLYKQVQKKLQLKSIFPKKTYLSSSLQEGIINHRKQELNKLIDEITKKQNNQQLIEFYEFLDIRNIYTKEKIVIGVINQGSKKPDQEIILDLLKKFNEDLENIQFTIKQIQEQIMQNRIKITGSIIRQLLVGSLKKKGILNYCIQETENYFVCLKGLEFLNKIFSFQSNRDAENYIKVFVDLPLKILKLNKRYIGFYQIKINYFKLLQIYLRRHSEFNLNSITKQLFYNNNQFIQEFQYWYKSRQKNSINVQLYLQLPIPRIQKKKSIIKSNIGMLSQYLSKQIMILVKEQNNQNYKIKLQRSGNNTIKITAQSKLPINQFQSIFHHSNKWNKKISKYKIDQYSKTIQYTINLRQQRTFKFNYQFQKSNITVLKKIPRGFEQQDSYLQIIQIQKGKPNQLGEIWSKVIILSHFQNSRSQQYFKEQIFGQTTYFLDSIKQIITSI